MNDDQLLAEVEDILRNVPPITPSPTDDLITWTGRAAAAITRWSLVHSGEASAALSGIGYYGPSNGISVLTLRKLLLQARADLRMEVGQLSVLVQQGQVFDYFDELRKMIEPASAEVFFVDPYLDADFVARYLPYVRDGVAVRLLGGPKRMPTLLPAVAQFQQQSGLQIAVRSSTNLHDRYLFVDRTLCFVSGASFKDGAKNAPAVLTQISDAFSATWDSYAALWAGAKVER